MTGDADTGGHAAARPSVTLILVPEQRPGQADALRRALAAQTDPDFELLQPRCSVGVVGSADDDRRVRIGPAIAMNRAAGRAGGDVLAFLAPDLEPAPDWVASVRRCFADADGPDVIAGRTVPRLERALDVAEAALDCPDAKADQPGCPCALHCAVRREAFEALGGFDERHPPAVLLRRPLGGLPLPPGERVQTSDRIAASRAPIDGLRAWLQRQWAAGRVAYYAPSCPVLGAGSPSLLGAPLRVARLARRKASLAPALGLLALGAVARAAGYVVAALLGGRHRHATPSPLLGPPSPSSVAPDGPSPTATVVVPVYGNPEWLPLCLEGLARQDFPERYEVVVSLESTDEVAQEFAERFPQMRIARCPDGVGPGGGRNVVFPIARGDYLAFTDDDCLPERDWLRRLVTACRSVNGEPVRGWLSAAYPYSYLSRSQQITTVGTVRPRKPFMTAGLGGCNMCLSRSLLDRTGARFAEGVYGAEEMVFLKELGVRRVLLDPDAVVRHLREEDVRGMLRRSYRLGRGSGRLRWQAGLRGALFARHVLLAPLLVPILFALSWLHTIRRAPHGVLDLVRFSPVKAASSVSYTAGFIAGALGARRAARGSPPRRALPRAPD